MQQVQLSEAEQRVYQAVTTLEARGQVPYPDLIAEVSGLTQEQVDSPLHLLTEKGLLHREDSPMAGLDFGPRSAPARWREGTEQSTTIRPPMHRVAIGNA